MMQRKKSKSLIPIFLTVGGGLLLIAAAVLMATQSTSTAPTPATSHEEETYPEISRVSIDEAKSALDAGTAVVVDVRSAEAYQGGHIAGAINIPMSDLEARLNELDKTQWFITYCT